MGDSPWQNIYIPVIFLLHSDIALLSVVPGKIVLNALPFSR